MIADKLVSYLDEGMFANKGEDLFLGFQPDSPDNCITVYDTQAPVLAESQGLRVDQFNVQILVRHEDYLEARDAIMAIHKALVGFSGPLFSGPDVSVVYADVSPASIGRDDKGRAEWSAHYRFRVMSTGDEFRI